MCIMSELPLGGLAFLVTRKLSTYVRVAFGLSAPSGVFRMSNFFLVARTTSKISVEILQVYCLNPRSTSR